MRPTYRTGTRTGPLLAAAVLESAVKSAKSQPSLSAASAVASSVTQVKARQALCKVPYQANASEQVPGRCAGQQTEEPMTSVLTAGARLVRPPRPAASVQSWREPAARDERHPVLRWPGLAGS